MRSNSLVDLSSFVSCLLIDREKVGLHDHAMSGFIPLIGVAYAKGAKGKVWSGNWASVEDTPKGCGYKELPRQWSL